MNTLLKISLILFFSSGILSGSSFNSSEYSKRKGKTSKPILRERQSDFDWINCKYYRLRIIQSAHFMIYECSPRSSLSKFEKSGTSSVF